MIKDFLRKSTSNNESKSNYIVPWGWIAIHLSIVYVGFMVMFYSASKKTYNIILQIDPKYLNGSYKTPDILTIFVQGTGIFILILIVITIWMIVYTKLLD